jgi:hypothetical protein
LYEDYARGIPDFALSEVAREATESMKVHLLRYSALIAGDPVQQRKMLQTTNVLMRELEQEIKALIEDKLVKFMRNS